MDLGEPANTAMLGSPEDRSCMYMGKRRRDRHSPIALIGIAWALASFGRLALGADSNSQSAPACDDPSTAAYVSAAGSRCLVKPATSGPAGSSRHQPVLNEPISIGEIIVCTQKEAILVITYCGSRETNLITSADMRHGQYMVPSVSPEYPDDPSKKKALRSSQLISRPAGSNYYAELQQQLAETFKLAQVTADGADLVSPGTVLVLKKDNLQMARADQPIPTANCVKDGTITQGGFAGFSGGMNVFGKFGAGGTDARTRREFVTGEKFFVTNVAVHPDGVTLSLISDPLNNQRYKSTLKFPWPKGAAPSPDEVRDQMAEIVKVEEPVDSLESPSPSASATISVGQSREQVITALGVPTKVMTLGDKEIDFFPDMKVTFIHGIVTKVE